MARAPPADDSDPEVIEFGIPVLDDHLDGSEVDFPANRAELRAEIGDLAVPYDAGGSTVQIGEALDRLEDDRFETKNELLDALHPVFEAHRQRSPGGIVARLRAYLPF